MKRLKYGIFNGVNKVQFHDGTLPAEEFYPTHEQCYLVEDGSIVGVLDQCCNLQLQHTKVVNGLVVVVGCERLAVDIPEGCDVQVHVAIMNRVAEMSETVLFEPVHPDGTKDWLSEDDSNIVDKRVLSAYEACKHLQGPERFRAMIPMLQGVEIVCEATVARIEDDYYIMDAYGTEIACRTQDTEQYFKGGFCVDFKDGKPKMMAVFKSLHKIELTTDFEKSGNRYIIADRDITGKVVFEGAVSESFADVTLIHVPEDAVLTDVSAFDKEIDLITSDRKYKEKLMRVVSSAMLKVPPSERGAENPIMQVCLLAERLM